MEVMKRILDDGNAVSVEFYGRPIEDNDYFSIFVLKRYSDQNQWRKNQVVTDALIWQFVADKKAFDEFNALGKLDQKSIKDLIDVFSGLKDNSKAWNEITISLPMAAYTNSRGIPTSARKVKSSFYPLTVKFSGKGESKEKDVSEYFADFDLFGSEAVQIAVQALLEGSIQSSQKEQVSLDGVEKLRTDLESGLSKE